MPFKQKKKQQRNQQHAGDPTKQGVVVGSIFAFLLALAVVALIYIAVNQRGFL